MPASSLRPPPGQRRDTAALSWSALVSTYLPALVLALGTGVALPAVPTLAKSFGVSFGVASGVVTAFLLGNVVGTVPSGWLIDRFGSRRIMIVGPILTAAMAFLVATAPNFAALLVYRFLDGFAAQMWVMGRLAAISHHAPPDQRGRQVNWMFGMDNIGRLAGPLVGGFIAAEWGIRAPFVVYGMLALLALSSVFAFTQDTPRRPRRSSTAEAVQQPSVRELVTPRLPYFAMAFVAALSRGPVQADLLHLYAAFAYHLGPRQIGYLATASTVVSLPTALLAGWLMDRFGRKPTMVPGFLGMAAAMAALAVSAFLHLSLAWYVTLFLLGVGAQSLTSGSVQTVGADVAPPQARGMFLGLWRFTGQGGLATSPIVFAVLADRVSYGSSFIFTGACAGVVTYLLIRHIAETRVSEPSARPAAAVERAAEVGEPEATVGEPEATVGEPEATVGEPDTG